MCTRILLILVLILTAVPSVAAGGADAAAQQAAARTGGRVLDVRTGQEGDQTVYFVRVLMEDGRVKVVRVPGAGRASGSR